MKKIAACFLVLLICLSFSIAPKDASAQPQYVPLISGAEEFLEEFLEDCYDRTSFSQAEKDAADWIAQKFEAFGLTTEIQVFDAEYNGKKMSSQNVIGTLDFGRAKQVIICAHYDNIYGSNDIEGFGAEGAYNNATGMAVMLGLAKHFSALKQQDQNFDLDFNIIFLALGAEEVGLHGSYYYVNQMLPKQISNTLLAIDLDCVGGGDYLYLYCDELKTVHERFIKQIADKNNLPLRLPPANKKTLPVSTPFTPYIHYGLNSANLYFLSAGVNSALFFSRNWHTNNKIGMVESEKHPAIIYTKDDNLKTLKTLYGDTFLQKMNAAADIIFYSLTDPEFVQTMQKSAAQRPNYYWLINGNLVAYIKLGLIVLMGIIVFFLIRNFTARYPVPVITIKPTPPPTVFGEEYEKNAPDPKDKKPPQNPFEGY